MAADSVFEERTRLKDLILRILKEEGSASISGIQKRLTRHGENLHRLIVTGYLRAMHDLGLLEERDLPPSKVYSLKAGQKHHDLYDSVGRVVAAYELPRGTEGRALVALLYRLFHRPVFKQEVVACGIEPLGLADWEVETKERQSARQRLVQAGFELPHNNPAFVPSGVEPEEEQVVEEALAELVVKGFRAHQYVLKGKQTTLRGM